MSSSPSRSNTTWSSSGETPTETLDLCGEVCPYTFVRTRLKLEELPLGAALRILLDHEPATRNVPRSAREWGQQVEPPTELEPGVWELVITKRAE